jgi:hypothetical protein
VSFNGQAIQLELEVDERPISERHEGEGQGRQGAGREGEADRGNPAQHLADPEPVADEVEHADAHNERPDDGGQVLRTG